MKIALTVFFYTVVFALIGAFLLGFAFQLITPDLITFYLKLAFEELNLRLIIGAAGLLFILISLATAQMVSGKIQREKTIAFSNPNGQVTVTLSAVEDLIKRLAHQVREIKDARADVKVGKKGIDIRMRVTLRSETNIPEFTTKLQGLITTKIQDVFGIDETITVKIHVAKILSEQENKTQKKSSEENIPSETTIPYQGVNY